MTKRLSAVIGEYTDKNNQPKAEWQNVGVLITGKNGKEYALLDPTVNLAGVLLKQNILAAKKNEAPSDMVMSSVFEEQQSQQQNNNQGQQQQQNNGGFQQNQQQQPQQGFQNSHGFNGQNQQ
jgi:hypothetical protein